MLSNLLKVCQSNDKLCQERLRNVEITCELLKKNDVLLKDYSICYPDDEEESDDKENAAEEEIKLLEIAKVDNTTEIENLEKRIKLLEDEQNSIRAQNEANKKVELKNTSDIEELKEKVSSISDIMEKCSQPNFHHSGKQGKMKSCSFL